MAKDERIDGVSDVGATLAPRRGRWPGVLANVLLVIAIVALLVATWMPAIYDRLATTQPSP
jgi:hypothetical protein